MNENRHSGSHPSGWSWIALGLVLLFVIVVRIRLLDLPLERDEGEFAYVGQLMLEGVAPYKMAYVIKLPGTAAVYALSMALFGQTAIGIHLGLLLANVVAIVLVFLLAKRWFGDDVGLIAGCTYALMSLSKGVFGGAAHATQFIVPAALGGILLLLRGLESGRLAALFWSGMLFGLAFLLKQPGILFGAFGGLLLLAHELSARPVDWLAGLKKIGVFCFGIILPLGVLGLAFWRAGVFGRFWYWSFAVAGGGWVTPRQGWDNFVWYANWTRRCGQLPPWILAGLILPFVFWMRTARPVRLNFLAFCAFSIFAGIVGWYFNPHYLVLTLPAAGMLIGLGVIEARRILQSSKSLAFVPCLPIALFCVVIAYAIFAEHAYFFSAPLDRVVTSIYATAPFREAVQVADYIKKNSNPGSQIAVLGSEPEIYFLAHRRSATGHVSTYILMEGRPYSHDMQEEMIREIKAASPEYIVYVDNILSWFPPAQADYTLLKSMMGYIKERYKRVGVVVTGPAAGQPLYYWDAAALDPPQAAERHSSYIFVYRLQKFTGANELEKSFGQPSR